MNIDPLDPVDVVVLAAYGSLVLELVVLPVPSVAATWRLATRGERFRAWRATWLVLPTVAAVLLWAAPPAIVLWPDLYDALGPVETLRGGLGRAVGAGLVVLGRLTTLWAVLRLRRTPSDTLQTGGPYRWTRNPALVGLHAFFAGTLLVFPCVALAAGLVLHAANMHSRVRFEERHLAGRHGEPYRRYASDVPRYVPRPFKRAQEREPPAPDACPRT